MTTPCPLDLQARILHRDGLMLVIDKPAGLPVHRGPKGGPTLEDHLDQLRFGLPHPPALAHRLDRGTSGCLVLGRHRKALARLGRLFAGGRVEKVYWADVRVQPPEREGWIELPLARRSAARGWWMRVDPAGQPARSRYRVLGEVGELIRLELRPETGRTHQLRVHLAAIGCPIVGDAIYGDDDGRDGLLNLHARRLTIPLYPNRPPIEVSAPLPPHMIPIGGTGSV